MKASSALKTFEKFLKATGKSSNTIKSYLHDLKLFTDYLASKKIQDLKKVSAGDIIDFFESRKVSNNTKNRLLYSIKQFFACLIMNEELTNDPTMPIKRFKQEVKAQVALSEDAIMKLRGVVKDSPKWNAIVELMLSLPLRVSEVCNLKEEDVYLTEDKIIIQSSKNKRFRELPLLEDVSKALRQYHKYKEKQAKKLKWEDPSDYFFVGQLGQQLSPRSVRYNLKQLYKKARIDSRASTHTLRHTVCTHYGLKGMDAFQLAALAGHQSLNTTQKYVKVTLKDKRDTINKLRI